MTGGHAVQVFVDGADQDLAPETVDGSFGLALFIEPLPHGDAVEVRAGSVFAANGLKALATAIFSRRSRKFSFRNEPVKWAGAGSRPARKCFCGLRFQEIKFAMK